MTNNNHDFANAHDSEEALLKELADAAQNPNSLRYGDAIEEYLLAEDNALRAINAGLILGAAQQQNTITVTSSPGFIPNPNPPVDIASTPRPSAPKKPLSARPPRKPKPPVMEFICGCDSSFHTTRLSEVQTHMVTQTHTRSHLKVTAQKIEL